jgi:glutaredoxin
MKVTVVYTMKGCPYCVQIKEELQKNDIFFIERDIYEYEDEYNEFVKITNNDYVPSLMLMTISDVEQSETAENVKFLAPERDYKDIFEGVEMVKNYLLD